MTDEPTSVLIVDDTDHVRQMLRTLLELGKVDGSESLEREIARLCGTMS
jgi:CheY-like chemotaxis protein